MQTSVTPHEARELIGNHMIVRDHFDFVMDLEKSHGHYIVDAREKVLDPDGTPRSLSLEDRTLLDFYTQFAAWPIGYNHPDLVEDEDFKRRMTTAAINKIANSDVVTTEKANLVRMMSELAIRDGLDYLFLIDGGALAVENALKAAFDWKIRLNFAQGRLYPEEEYVIAHFKDAFHGRSGYTMSLTNTDPDKVRFFPKFTSWPRLNNPALRFPMEHHRAEVEQAEARTFRELEQAIKEHPHRLAAVIIEPVQAEGGDHHFRPEFFRKLRRMTEENDILLILDEVQTGCGLTGKFWAYQHFGIIPDILSFGKKMQVCGVLANRRVFDRVDDHVFVRPGRINSTWGSNLVDMVRCTRLLEIIRDRKLVDNAATQGAVLLEGLHRLERQFPEMVTNARGLGLMTAFDFRNPALRAPFVAEMRKNRVLTLTCGPASVRLRPMLDVEKRHIDHYLEAAERSLEAIRRA